MLRLHLDENVDLAVAIALRARGIDVSTAQDAGLREASDADHLRFAIDQDRVIFTHDSDFLVLAASGVPHAGVAFCRQQSRTIGQVIKHLEMLAHCYSTAEMANRIEFL